MMGTNRGAHVNWFIKHAPIRETAYQSQLKRTRQQLHARGAQMLDR